MEGGDEGFGWNRGLSNMSIHRTVGTSLSPTSFHIVTLFHFTLPLCPLSGIRGLFTLEKVDDQKGPLNIDIWGSFLIRKIALQQCPRVPKLFCHTRDSKQFLNIFKYEWTEGSSDICGEPLSYAICHTSWAMLRILNSSLSCLVSDIETGKAKSSLSHHFLS